MLHRLGTQARQRTESIETDRVELHRLALELERMLVKRAQKISESGRFSGAGTRRRKRR